MNKDPFIIIRNYRRKAKPRKASYSTAAHKQAKDSFISQQVGQRIRQRKLTMAPITQKAIEQEVFEDERDAKSEGFMGDSIDQYFSFHNQERRVWVEDRQFYLEQLEIDHCQQKQKQVKIKNGEAQCEMEFEQFVVQCLKGGRFM